MKLFGFLRRGAREREMDAEMRFHLDMEAAELERTGVPPDEARRRALASFGGVTRYKEEGHEARGGSWWDDLTRDTRYGVRALLRTPGYALVVVATLALGVAANTSIFSVANGILFKPLPYRDPAKLMVLWDGLDWIGVPEAWVTGPEVVKLRQESKLFEGFAAMRSASVLIDATDGAEPLQVPASVVSANFFQILGTGPEIGRGFLAGEDAPGQQRLAVISRRLWTQRFGADSGIVGKSIRIDGGSIPVVGVLPRTFRFSPQQSLGSAGQDADVYLTMPDTLARMVPNNHSIGVLARVRSDVSVPNALSELAEISRRIDAEVYGKQGFKFVPVLLQERMVREVRPALLALLAAVGTLLLIMCANLAVLALVRAAGREREITVRRAIGASHGRVTRQILTETVILSLAGAAVGVLLGKVALRGLLAIAPPGLPRRAEIGIDWLVLAVTIGIALVVGIAMGLAPVVHSVRADISAVLREKAPSRSGRGVRRVLVLGQLALSMVLLAGTGLLLGSFVRLMRVDGGFNPDNVLLVEILVSRAKYSSGAPVVDAVARFAEALRGLPGVTAVGASMAPPLSAGANQSGVWFPGAPGNTGAVEHDRVLADNASVTEGYFRAMGIPLVRGEEFGPAQRDSVSARVAIISEDLANKFFPNVDPIGRMMLIDGDTLRIHAVARHVRMYGLHLEGRGQVWTPHRYAEYRYMAFAVRTNAEAGDPSALSAAARKAIRDIDPDQPIIGMTPMTENVKNSLAERRLVLTLVGTFAAAALLLAALGVYGVTASSVSQRTREFGIRMALGAKRSSVIGAVLSEPLKLVSAGLLIGLAGTWASGRILQRLLYGMEPMDPVTIAAVVVVLLLVAVLASYLPARRATRVDPIVALRAD